MNRRVAVEVLIVLLLVLLLVFMALSKPQKRTRIDGDAPKTSGVPTDDLSVPLDATIREEPIDPADSPPEENKAIAEVLTHSGMVNEGTYEVFGVVENVGEITARQVTAVVTFKSIKWKLLGKKQTLVDRPTLAPGEQSRFRVILKTDNARDVASYVLLFTVVR